MDLSRLEKRLLGQMGALVAEHALVEEGDRVLVAMSGGKDSYGLLHLLELMRRRVPFRFELVAVHLDQGHPGHEAHKLEAWLASRGFEHRILHRDTLSIVKEKTPEGGTFCALCSRLRRGILYDAAVELGCTKLALGHHREDVLETLLMNLCFGGRLQAMPPRFTSDDGRNVVIRPLAACAEADLVALSQEQDFPVLPCNLCGSQDGLQRQKMKALLDTLERDIPQVRSSMLSALGNVRASHLFDRAVRREG